MSMIFIADSRGNINAALPSDIHQNSTLANSIILLAPIPQATAVTVSFTLPNGIRTTPSLAKPGGAYNMENLPLSNVWYIYTDESGAEQKLAYSAWTLMIEAPVSEYAGTVTAQFFWHSSTIKTVYASDGAPSTVAAPVVLPSSSISFNVEKGATLIDGTIETPATLQGVFELLSTVLGELTAVGSNADSNSAAIAVLQPIVADLQTRMTAAENNITANTGNISTLRSDLQVLRGNLGTLTIRVTTAENDIAALQDITLVLDTSTYVLSLKDGNGNVLGEQIDLPIESVVVGASYDESTKSIVLTLQNGETLTVPVGDLISGLVEQKQPAYAGGVLQDSAYVVGASGDEKVVPISDEAIESTIAKRDSSGELHANSAGEAPTTLINRDTLSGALSIVGSNVYNEAKAYTDEQIANVQTDLTAAEQKAQLALDLLRGSFIAYTSVQDTYRMRKTGGDLSVVNDMQTPVQKVQGATVASGGKLYNAFFKGITSTGSSIINKNITSGSRNGITYTLNADGAILASGTATANTYISVGSLVGFKIGDTFRLIGTPAYAGNDNVYLYVQFRDASNTLINVTYYDKGSGATVVVPEGAVTGSCNIGIRTGGTVDNALFCPIVYDPSVVDSSFEVATAVELGKWDSIDVPNQRLLRQTETFSFNGTEAWIQSTTGVYIVSASATDLICNLYNFVGDNQTPSNNGECSIYDGYFYIRDDSYTSVADFTAHLADLAEAGTPLTVAYKAATSTEESISIPTGYTVWNNGSETVVQGATDNSQYGALCTVTQEYFNIVGGETA